MRAVTRLLLLRHAAGDHIGRTLAGRSAGVHLNALGRAQAERLGEYVATLGVHALYASPRERARETAEPLARRLGMDILDAPALDEVDYGEWTGLEHGRLTGESWRWYNTYRSGTRVPGGELLLEVQARAVAELLRLAERHPEQTVVAVSHADPIRVALVHFLGMPIDHMLRLDVAPASLSEVVLETRGVRVVRINDTRAVD